jgi:hypothetical protein
MVWLKSFLAGMAALSAFMLPFLGGILFTGGFIVARFSEIAGFGVAGLMIFAIGFGWEYRRASRQLSSR